MRVERGISFKEALQKMNTDFIPGDGFCISNKVHCTCILCTLLALDQIPKSKYMCLIPDICTLYFQCGGGEGSNIYMLALYVMLRPDSQRNTGYSLLLHSVGVGRQ